VAEDGRGGDVDAPLGHLLRNPSHAVLFTPFGEICDMLIESAGYEDKSRECEIRGVERLISMIAEHPNFKIFK
jgi:hypothetical protein